MKRLFIFVLSLILCTGLTLTAYAKEKEETTIDQSQPRLMVTDYKLEGGALKPSSKSKLDITFKNYSSTKALKNIKLSLVDESGELETEGMPTKFVDVIYAGNTYVWSINLKAASTAQIGEHKLSVTSEYEDKYYGSYSGNDIISVNVKQSVSLDYDGVMLSPKCIQGDTETVTVNLMNTGKTDLRNCKVAFDIKGLESGGALFIGEIPAGESKEGNANLRVSTDLLGETKGTATISYEDAYGEDHSEKVELSTIIEEKVIVADVEEDEKEGHKYPLWWAFALAGLAVGGGVGFAVPTAIHSSKQRKEDELRL